MKNSRGKMRADKARREAAGDGLRGFGTQQAKLHPVPAVPHTVAFGLSRMVAARTPMVALDYGQYSVPHRLLGQQVWVRVPELLTWGPGRSRTSVELSFWPSGAARGSG